MLNSSRLWVAYYRDANLAPTVPRRWTTSVVALILGTAVSLATTATVEAGGGVAGELFTDITRFSLEARHELPHPHNGFRLGHAVAMTETTLVVGSPGWGVSVITEKTGAVAVYERSAEDWARVAILTASDGIDGDFLGRAVAVSGDTVVATVMRPGRNAVYLFEKPAGGWSDMTETAVLFPSDGEESFGISVAASSGTVVAGAPRADGIQGSMDSGAIYLFERPAAGWVSSAQSQKIPNPINLFGALFGTSVALQGDRLVVGSPKDTGGFTHETGVAYVFERPAGGAWGGHRLLRPMDGIQGQLVGGSVALDGDTVVLGTGYNAFTQHPASGYTDYPSTDGAAYVFVRPPGGWNTIHHTAKLDHPFATFGSAVAIRGGTVLVGAPLATMPWFGFGRPEGGQLYAFERPVGGWVDAIADTFNPLHPSDIVCYLPYPALCGLRFGHSLALSSHTAVVGAAGLAHTDGIYTFVDPVVASIFFADSFESGNTSAWSAAVGGS